MASPWHPVVSADGRYITTKISTLLPHFHSSEKIATMGQCVVTDDSDFDYCPSTAAAILFSVLFGLSTLLHLIQAIVYRKRFCWVIIMAGLWETAGFVTRVFASHDINNDAFGIPSQLLIILAPLWINAYDYMVLGRMVYYYHPQQRIAGIRAARLALWFVLLDITAFLIQGTGGSMLSPGNDANTIQIGLHVYMGGVGFQQLFVLLFIVLTVKVYKDLQKQDAGRPTNWRPLLRVLLVSLTLISIRVIYRLVEFSQGVTSTLTNHEAPFYCLEALPMIVALVLFNIWHPGAYLKGPESEFPKKEKKKKKKKGKKTESMEMQLHPQPIDVV